MITQIHFLYALGMILLSAIISGCGNPKLFIPQSENTEIQIVGGGTERMITFSPPHEPPFTDLSPHQNLPSMVQFAIPIRLNEPPPRWFLRIKIPNQTQRIQTLYCAGTIVGEQTILTARHCFYPNPPYMYVTKTHDLFIQKHLQDKQNSNSIYLGWAHNRAQWSRIPPQALQLSAHPHTDLATITTKGCRLYESERFFSPVRSRSLNTTHKAERKGLSAYGYGGSFEFNGQWSIQRSSELHSKIPSYFPYLYNPSSQLPEVFPTTKELCEIIRNSGCITATHPCAQPPAISHFKPTTTPCDKDSYNYSTYFLKANQYLLKNPNKIWTDITKRFPGLAGTMALYHPHSMSQNEKNGHYFCSGDSGGPVVAADGQLVGVLSSILANVYNQLKSPEDNLLCSSMIFAVDVASYHPWISSQITHQPQTHLPLCSHLWGSL